MQMKIADLEDARRMLLIGMGFPGWKSIMLLNGYPALHVQDGGKKRVCYIHRLVAEHYLAVKLHRRIFIHHKNEDRTDFRVGNLEPCSPREHSGMHRKVGVANNFFGKRHGEDARRKISEAAKMRERERDSGGKFVGRAVPMGA